VELDLYSAQFLPAFPEYGTELYNIALEKRQIIEKYKGRTKTAFIPEGYKRGNNSDNLPILVVRIIRELLTARKSVSDLEAGDKYGYDTDCLGFKLGPLLRIC